MPIAAYFDNFLKNNYSGEQPAKLINEDHPYLDLISKSTGTGLQFIDTLIDKNATGVAATLANAQTVSGQTNNSNVGGAQWIIPWGEYDGSVVIPDKTMSQSASDLGAFFEVKKEEIDSLYREFGDAMEQYLVRDSGHSLGYGAESVGVITLTNKSDAVNFCRGMCLVASANDGTDTSHTLLGSGSIGYVISVNANAGTVTVSTTSGGTAGEPSSWTGTVYLFRVGDFGGTSSPNQIVDGYGAFIPVADPSATPFRNVVRTTDIVARSGVRLTAAECAQLNNEQRIKKLYARMASMRGCKPGKVGMLHPIAWQSLAESFESRGQRSLDGKLGICNFEKLEIATAAGRISIYPNKYLPIDAYYAINPDFIKIKHLDGLPKVLNGDGLQMLRSATANTYEHRIVAYPAHVVRAPGHQGRCPLSVTF